MTFKIESVRITFINTYTYVCISRLFFEIHYLDSGFFRPYEKWLGFFPRLVLSPIWPRVTNTFMDQSNCNRFTTQLEFCYSTHLQETTGSLVAFLHVREGNSSSCKQIIKP